jgi:pyruvate,water dikinase
VLICARRDAAARASADRRHLPSFFVAGEGVEYEGLLEEDASPAASGGARRWRGVGVSPGSATGIARVILDPVSQAGQLRPGDVLVARATDPGWTPLFLIAAAAVVERGGMLSHAAIVAREVGIPVVVEVAHASSTFVDGEEVRVDGDTGLVEAVGDQG